MGEIRLTGRAASPGLALGPLVLMEVAAPRREATDDPAHEAAALRGAIETATGALSSLAAASEGEAQDILSFQVAMLEDEALAEGAFHAIEAGIPADAAWHAALDAEIAGYQASDDEY